MEQIDDEMMKRVLDESQSMNFQDFTPWDVESALGTSSFSHEDFAALLYPRRLPLSGSHGAKGETVDPSPVWQCRRALHATVYRQLLCQQFVYCGFNCRKNNIHRGKLTMAEIETEFQAIAKTGLREILILTGESRHQSSLEYIGEASILKTIFFPPLVLKSIP